MRRTVLNSWPSGDNVEIKEAITFHRGLSQEKAFPFVLARADAEHRTLTQPRSGVALLDDHIALLNNLQEQGRADLLSTTVDSYTRHNRYEEAQRGMEESERLGRSMLNGLPVVSLGVNSCRRIVEELERPVQIRHGSPDARLLAEISFAAGFTAFEGGAISYCLPYTKAVSLERAIRDWQYVDALAGFYEREGVTINREPFGALTGTLVPPSTAHAISIVEALLAAEQGVKDISVGYGQCGNLVQDVAALATLKELTIEHLGRMGYEDVRVTTVFHQWMGAFPATDEEALAVIAWGGVTAASGRATKVITKSVHEAKGIPTAEANSQGVRVTRAIMDLLVDQNPMANIHWSAEADLIRLEVESIMDTVYALSEGHLAAGAERAIRAGVLDVPFSPHRDNAGRALPLRDAYGAVRYLEFGNIPIPEEAKAFHNERLQPRLSSDGRPPYELVFDDVTSVKEGRLLTVRDPKRSSSHF